MPLATTGSLQRDLATTVRMLESAGLTVGVGKAHGRVHVCLSSPLPGQAPQIASFAARDGDRAADWLVARVLDLYPQSELAKLWRVIAAAAAAAAQGEQ